MPAIAFVLVIVTIVIFDELGKQGEARRAARQYLRDLRDRECSPSGRHAKDLRRRGES